VRLRTLCDILRRLETEPPKPDLLLHKKQGAWTPIATGAFCRAVRDAARGLRALGIRPGDRVAILSENRPEWAVADHAILAAGAVAVPIYPTLLPDQVEYILGDSGAAVALVSTPEQAAKIEAVRPRLRALRDTAVFDGPVHGARVWESVVAAGAAAGPSADAELGQAAPGDLASLIYTSGTTGRPKGVMLTHGNFAHNIAACCDAIPFAAGDRCLSLLPLSHVYERMVEYCYLWRGASIAYATSIDALAANMLEVRPTIVCAVPRLFEKLHLRLLDQAAAASPPRRALMLWAMRLAEECGARLSRPPAGAAEPLPLRLRLGRAVADRLVYARLRGRLGGRLRFFISGSAPLGVEMARMFLGMGIRIVEGYGMTECSPVIAVSRLDAICVGSVGPPLDGLEVRIADDGEIVVRGPSVMRGYWNNDEATRETLQDGWLLTGDIGRFDAHGCLVITDRKKEVLKTSAGKMVAPQPIENLLRADRFIGQAVVIGDRRNYLTALLVPNFDQIRSYAALKGLPEAPMPDLLKHPRVLDLFERRVAAINERLARFERIRKFRLLERDLTVEEGEITPTLKPRRKVIQARYRDLIDEMYAEPPPLAAAAGEAGLR
jgi:long-chain acyl-CoA synthetase